MSRQICETFHFLCISAKWFVGNTHLIQAPSSLNKWNNKSSQIPVLSKFICRKYIFGYYSMVLLMEGWETHFCRSIRHCLQWKIPFPPFFFINVWISLSTVENSLFHLFSTAFEFLCLHCLQWKFPLTTFFFIGLWISLSFVIVAPPNTVYSGKFHFELIFLHLEKLKPLPALHLNQ